METGGGPHFLPPPRSKFAISDSWPPDGRGGGGKTSAWNVLQHCKGSADPFSLSLFPFNSFGSYEAFSPFFALTIERQRKKNEDSAAEAMSTDSGAKEEKRGPADTAINLE